MTLLFLCGRRVVVFAAGTRGSGIPPGWAATRDRPGVHLLPDLSARTAADVGTRVRLAKRPGDIVVFTVHWGSNWGYRVPADQVLFAHDLVAHGVDVVHGHSSPHPRPIEIYRGRLILYGCGDFVDDYEGIAGARGVPRRPSPDVPALGAPGHRPAGPADDDPAPGPPHAAAPRDRT